MANKVQKQMGRHNGRYFMIVDGFEPEITFIRIPGSDDIVANHTGVPVPLRGQGIAETLVRAMVEDAQRNDFKIVPACPYIEALYKRNPEWSSLMIELPEWME